MENQLNTWRYFRINGEPPIYKGSRMMSNYGGQQLLVVDSCFCQTQIQLPSASPIYLVGKSFSCRRCYACTRFASPGFASYYSAVAYYVPLNSPPHAAFSSFHHNALRYQAPIKPLPHRGFPYSALDYYESSLANDYSLLQSLSLATPSSGPEKDKANSSNSSTNEKWSPPQTQITKDDKPKQVAGFSAVADDQKPSTMVSKNQVSRNHGNHNGSFSVGNTTEEHDLIKDKAKSSNSSTSAKSSPPSQTQITEDDEPEDDRKPCIVVSGNQIRENKGNGNGSFSVGNTHKTVVVNIQ